VVINIQNITIGINNEALIAKVAAAKADAFVIYPNPASAIAYIRANAIQIGKTATIYNTNGQSVLEIKLDGQTRINTGAAKGIYMMRMAHEPRKLMIR